ncbi:MAG: HDIG domain-containing protein [Coprothermobacterota bacterium]|nr:HDIG domain-containing protein [Coprothermobacterota bacterium]
MNKPRTAWELGGRQITPGAKRLRLFLMAAVLYLLFLAVLISFLFPPTVDVSLGSVADEDVIAPRNAIYIDGQKTEELQTLAEQSVMPVYQKDFTPARQNMLRTQINNFFNIIEQVVINGALTNEEKAARLSSALPPAFTSDVIQAALRVDSHLWTTLLSYSMDIAQQFLAAGVKEEDLTQLSSRIREKVGVLGLPEEAKAVMVAACQAAITPNLTLDREETERRREVARNSVDPVRRQIAKGEIIVKKGETVREEQLPMLEALGLQRREFPWEKLVGTVLISLALFATWTAFSLYFGSDFLTVRRMLFVALLFTLIVLAARFLPPRFIYLIPIPLAAICLSSLFNLPFAVVFAIFASLAVGLIQGNDFLLSFAMLLGGAAGAYSVRRVGKTGDFLAAGLTTGLALAFAVGASGLSLGKGMLMLEEMGWAFANGLLSGVFAIFFLLLPATENFFDLTSPLHLIELANPNQRLLRRLFLEVPGTYLHSVMVASLSESAASAIGANVLLARVAAYYHDVGKLVRPDYFAENQGEFNVHERMTPQLSTTVVTAHTRDGADMARAAGVPEPVVAMIQSHHGTSLTSYFYRQAQRNSDEATPEESYRYDGPKPQSKEACILMLADGVEAGVRSLREKSPERISKMVGTIFADRVKDGQLERSELSFRELEQVEKVFVRVLVSAYHLRPEYPEPVSKERKWHVDLPQQSAPPNPPAEKTAD